MPYESNPIWTFAALILAACAGPPGPAGANGIDGKDARTSAVRLLDERIRGWTETARSRLNGLIAEKGRASADYDPKNRPVAAFDWDNTVFKNDMGDATFYWMVRHDKILQPPAKDWSASNANLTAAAKAALNAACDGAGAPGSPLATSSNTACADEIFAIYDSAKTRAGADAFNHSVTLTQNQAYLWLAQLGAGYPMGELREFARAAYDENAYAPAGSTQTVGTTSGVTAWGRIYDQMNDLIGALHANGFDVWIVSASPQWVVEPVAEHVGVDADHVVGIRTVFAGGKATSALQGCGGVADGPDAPITFENGKRCWINKVVFHMPDGPAQLLPNPDPKQRQVFAAGDSDTDIAFVRDATSLKLALNRNKTELMCNAYANAGGKWVVQPMFIGPKSQKTSGYACSTAKDAAGNPIVDENGQPIPDQADSVFTLGQ